MTRAEIDSLHAWLRGEGIAGAWHQVRHPHNFGVGLSYRLSGSYLLAGGFPSTRS